MPRKTAREKVLDELTTFRSMTFEQMEDKWRAEGTWKADWINLVGGLIHMAFVESKGVNYVSFRASLNLIDASKEYEVIIQRAAGLTPAEKNAQLIEELVQAKTRIAELRRALQFFVTFHGGHVLPPELQGAMAEARAAREVAEGGGTGE